MLGPVVRKQDLDADCLGAGGAGWGLPQSDLYAQEAGLAGRAAGTSLLRMEPFGEQRKAAGKVVGPPASPGSPGSLRLPPAGAVLCPCEAGTWEQAPPSHDTWAVHVGMFLPHER